MKERQHVAGWLEMSLRVGAIESLNKITDETAVAPARDERRERWMMEHKEK